MRTRWKKPGWLLVGLLVGCGGFDPDYHCEQQLDCEGTATGSNVDRCVEIVEAAYDELSDPEKEEFDAAYDACKEEKSCDYEDCFQAKTD